jgi:hypothetical protein
MYEDRVGRIAQDCTRSNPVLDFRDESLREHIADGAWRIKAEKAYGLCDTCQPTYLTQ